MAGEAVRPAATPAQEANQHPAGGQGHPSTYTPSPAGQAAGTLAGRAGQGRAGRRAVYLRLAVCLPPKHPHDATIFYNTDYNIFNTLLDKKTQ